MQKPEIQLPPTNESRKKLEAFARLLSVMDELREKCPWDREQTFDSLRNCTIEETYELVDAIAARDYDEIRKELGDLMLHVVFYSKIADEEGRFDVGDVVNSLCDKLIFRHPHVFGEVVASDADQVIVNWEQIKLREKKKNRGILGGVPKSLPAMVKAYRIGEKAAAAGFDWEKKEDVWEKVKEETGELEAELQEVDAASAGKRLHTYGDHATQGGAYGRMEEEFGDLLFSIVNAARLYGVDPELALEKCNKKFIGRFNHLEQRADEAGRPLKDFTLNQMEEWWQEAKRG